MNMSDEPQLYYLSHEDFVSDVRAVAQKVAEDPWQPDYVIGIGRGGLVPAVYISHQLDLPMLSVDHSSKVPGFADELLGKVAEKSRDGTKLLVIDDINDSGRTIEYIRRLLAAVGCEAGNLRFAVLISNSRSKVSVDYWSRPIDRNEDKRWFVFPWEAMGTRDTIKGEALSVPERLA
jgi:xanthine phosphoribosyltransferase